jgi:hypothetical protein
MKRKLGTTIAAMMLAAQLGSPLAAAEPTVEQLGEIATYLENNNVRALRLYLQRYPDLMEGDGQLAALLREFYAESSDVTNYLRFEPDIRDAIERALPTKDNDPADFPSPERDALY